MVYLLAKECTNKCPKCGEYMNDLGYHEEMRGIFNIFECPNCFYSIEVRMELYGREW